MPARELADRLDARELIEWEAFERVNGPILIHERLDVAAARISFMLSNGKASAESFLPEWDSDARRDQSVEEMIAVMRSFQKPKEVRGEPDHP